jgi:hypothetical protein
LKPETVANMHEPLPAGLGHAFSVTNIQGVENAPVSVHPDKLLAHFGGNPGWSAHFLIHATRREGFVVANNSSQGFLFEIVVQKLWLKAVLGVDAGTDPDPEEGITPRINRTALKIAVTIGALLLAATAWCGIQIARGKRHRAWPRTRRTLLLIGPPVIVMLVWWYLFYAPRSLPLPIGPGFLSLWMLPFIHYGTALMLGWMGVAVLFALFPRRPPLRASDSKM